MTMAKINISLGAREITEHYAAGEHARNYQRALIAEHAPLFYVIMGGVPRYDDMGVPVNAPAIKATIARKARLEARRIAAAARNAAAKAERVATAARFAAANAIASDDGADSEYDFENEESETRMLHGDN